MIPLSNREYINARSSSSIRTLVEDKVKGWITLIASDRNRRNLFLFLLLNFSFAFVELAYGIWSNSLGLISDSCHMFFDCAGLVISLVASIISKRKADDKYSYGYVRAEPLAAFSMGLLLLFIALTVCNEALHRFVEPPEVQHERLFVVSVLGLFVNLIGICAFQHGHPGGHCSHGHGHGHSHNHKQEHSPLNSVSVHKHHNHSHSHSHSHHFHEHDSGGSQLMKGVFLHILADTLGSVSVIVSTVLMHTFGWMRADPVCSLFIAVMIALSVIPLLSDASSILMQRQPRELDGELPYCYQKVTQLSGVYSVVQQHFWTLCNGMYVGTLKLEVAKDADPAYVVSQTHRIYSAIGIQSLTVQLDYPMKNF